MSELRVRSDTSVGFVPGRKVPINHLLVTATTSGGAQTIYTVRAGVALQVKRLAVTNITGSAATFSLHSVPPSGSVANGNAEMIGLSIPANTSADLTDFIGGFYVAGTTLRVYAGTGSALVVHGWGEEVL